MTPKQRKALERAGWTVAEDAEEFLRTGDATKKRTPRGDECEDGKLDPTIGSISVITDYIKATQSPPRDIPVKEPIGFKPPRKKSRRKKKP